MPADATLNLVAARALLAGVNRVGDEARRALGPKGHKRGAPGAAWPASKDPFEAQGEQILADVAVRTETAAHDGTATAAVLAQAIIVGGLRHIEAGADPILLQRGIEQAAGVVVESINEQARAVRAKHEIQQVAAVASGDPSIAELLATIVDRVGRDGVVAFEPSDTPGLEATYTSGMQIDKGYLSPDFVADVSSAEVVLDQPAVALVNSLIGAADELEPLLDLTVRSGHPLLVVAHSVTGEALATLVDATRRGPIGGVAAGCPGFGRSREAILGDIAALIGGRVVGGESGLSLQAITATDLGRARRVTVSRDTTILIEGAGTASDMKTRIGMIRASIEGARSEEERADLFRRLAKLASGAAVVRVGAATAAELDTIRRLLEDTMHVVRAAMEGGYVPGGGVALVRAGDLLAEWLGPPPRGAQDPSSPTPRPWLRRRRRPPGPAAFLTPDEYAGARVLLEALPAPLVDIGANAGLDGAVVLERVRRMKKRTGFEGFNAATGQYEDLSTTGIIDAANVTRSAVEIAAGSAGQLLSSPALLTGEGAVS